MKIEAAIFDIGNVLLLFDYTIAAEALKRKNALTELPDREAIVAAKNSYESGGISRATFLERVRPRFQDTGDEQGFVTIWQDIFTENSPMVALARQLAERMPVYLISNISCIHWDHITSHYEFFTLFRDSVLSYRAKLMKPNPAIFDLAIRQFAVNPTQTLFFDDMPENVESASKSRLNAFLYSHTNHAAAEEFVARFVLPDKRELLPPKKAIP